MKKESAPSPGKKRRASVGNDGDIIPRYDMARDDPEAWARACRGLAAMLCAAWALGVALWAAGGAL